MKKKHYITIRDNLTVDFKDLVSFKQDLLTLKGKEAYLIVDKVTKSRSGNQNRYYWGVVIELLSKETGYEREEMHEAMKMQFLRNPEESRFCIAKGTSTLTTAEFEEYMSKIRQWASQYLTLYIPDPNEIQY